VVNVRKRSSVNAPNSDSTPSATSSMPPSSAGRSCGSTTRTKLVQRLQPSARALSSSAGSMPRKAAATGR
jgi:hypothetical protein